MNSMTSMLAIAATNALWDVPGERKEPIVPPITAAAAAAGLIPARNITGIKVEPTAAAQPAADGRAMLMKKVTIVQIGIRRTPKPRIGEAK
ncbi:unknown [Sutterella sp. CAG:521]|nr:unknown [Sutterella sp. CAG:521]